MTRHDMTKAVAHAAVWATLMMAALALPRSAWAQQRPLVTEDPAVIGAGQVLVQGGFDWLHSQPYPVSGLKGNLIAVPTLGIFVGLSSIAELEFYGAPYQRLTITSRQPAPLSNLLTAQGDTTSDVQDLVVGTKVRILGETSGRPALGIRFATKLPNASNQSGLGLNTTDFLGTLLIGKTIESVRVVGNIGAGILGDPTVGYRQNDVILYGVSFARAITAQVDMVGEINGRANTRAKGALPGTDSQSELRFGGRYTRGPMRLDAGVLFGMTSQDPSIGLTAGVTYVFNAFRLPQQE